jgi:hypothetical protein
MAAQITLFGYSVVVREALHGAFRAPKSLDETGSALYAESPFSAATASTSTSCPA